MDSAKKQKERSILNSFINCYPDFLKGKIVGSEAPDFIIKITTKKTIGIELTGLQTINEESKELLVPDLFKETLELAIANKEEKIRSYKKNRLDYYWLLLVLDHPNMKTFNLGNKLGNWKFSTSFHKVFLYDMMNNQAFDLELFKY